MIRDEIVQLVRDNLAFHKTLNEAIILRHMRSMQMEYESGDGELPLPWFLVEEATVNLTIGQTDAELPENFIAFDEDYPLNGKTIPDTFYIPIERRYEMGVANELRVPGRPLVWTLFGHMIRIYPVPTEAYELRIPGYYHAEDVRVDDESPWVRFFPNLLLAETTLRVAKATRDGSAIQLYASDVQRAKSSYFRKVEEMKVSHFEIVMGGNG